MTLCVTVRTQQNNILSGSVRLIFINVVNGKNSWFFMVTAILAQVRAFLENPFLLGLRGSHRSALQNCASKLIPARLRAGHCPASFDFSLSDSIRFLAYWTDYLNALRPLASSGARTANILNGALTSTVFSTLCFIRNEMKGITASTTHQIYFCLLGLVMMNKPSRTSISVIIFSLIRKRKSATTGTETILFHVPNYINC